MEEAKLKKLVPVLAVVLVIIFVHKTGIFGRKKGAVPGQGPLTKSGLMPGGGAGSPALFQKGSIDKKNIIKTAEDKKEDTYKVDRSKLRWQKNIFEPALKADTAQETEKKITGVAVEDLKFTSWIQRGKEVMAVVSDKIVRIGDKLESKKGILNVVQIEKDMVILQDIYGENYIVTSAAPFKTEKAAAGPEVTEPVVEVDVPE